MVYRLGEIPGPVFAVGWFVVVDSDTPKNPFVAPGEFPRDLVFVLRRIHIYASY